ncbi:MAG: aldo/keto reductase [Bryobacteraceae bacterium]|jgi:aryl-alcohol dehydrogenase-like predicted oxidoreductase
MERRILGRTGLDVGRLGLAASFGVPSAAVEQAFERGANYLYWGSFRRGGFGQAIRNLKPRRDRMVLVLQSYSRVAALVAPSVEIALRRVNFEFADVLLLGLWNHLPPRRILDAAARLRERGLVRHIAVSTHHRPLVEQLAADPDIGIVHVRYNAAHTGAEREVFPVLASRSESPGAVAFTATSWRQLMNPRNVPPGERVPTAADCYRFVLSNPSVDVCMSGPASADQAEQAFRAIDAGPMNEEELAWMRRVGNHIHGR